MRQTEISHQAFHRGTSPMFDLLTVEQIKQLANLHLDPTLLERLQELAGKANEGGLAESERQEYEGYIEANHLLAILRAEARHRVSVQTTA